MTDRLKVLQVAPELAPIAKVGGLGDVVAAVSKEMAHCGHDVRIVLPRYGFLESDETWTPREDVLVAELGWGIREYARVWETYLPGTKAHLFLLEHNAFFERHEIYTGPWGEHPDNDRRFSFLCRAALDLCYSDGWFPDVIHCHDWTTGLLPVYLNTRDWHTQLGRAATVFTIHNLQHQGYVDRSILPWAGVPEGVFRPDNVESMGRVNLMKAGLYNSTKLTTVSENYAAEIQTPEYGCGLNHVLRFRAADLVGILNGIDTDIWNPQLDPLIPANFSAEDLSGKATCKAALQRRFGLDEDPTIPVFSAVARLYDQKGLDLFAEIIPGLVKDMRLQVVVLGSGDPILENRFKHLAYRFPGKVGVHIGYDNPLSHLIEAGADFFVMPSRFEPCGLNQMYSMAYGTLPIVRSTGGLVDSVEQYEEGRPHGTGFRFEEPSASALYFTIGWANATYYDRPEELAAMRERAMRRNLSWENSVERYEAVYRWAIAARNPQVNVSHIRDEQPEPATDVNRASDNIVSMGA